MIRLNTYLVNPKLGKVIPMSVKRERRKFKNPMGECKHSPRVRRIKPNSA